MMLTVCACVQLYLSLSLSLEVKEGICDRAVDLPRTGELVRLKEPDDNDSSNKSI